MTEEQLLYRLKNIRNEEAIIQKGFEALMREQSSHGFSPERLLDELIAAETLRAVQLKPVMIVEQRQNRQHEIELNKLKRARSECETLSSHYEELLERSKEVQTIKKAILELEQPAQIVLFERYLEGKTVKQSLKSICVSEATYWRVHRRGLLLLLSSFESQKLRLLETV